MTETMVDWGDVEDTAEFTGEQHLPRGEGTSRARRTGGGRRVSDRRLTSLKEKLSSEMFQAGAMIGLGVPVTGYYICQESDNFCTAVVSLAAKKTEWIAALENIALLGPGITVGRFAVGLGAAAAADRYHRTGGESGLDPEKRIAMFLGVTSAYMAVHPPEGEGGSSRARNGYYSPPPNVEFVPVS